MNAILSHLHTSLKRTDETLTGFHRHILDKAAVHIFRLSVVVFRIVRPWQLISYLDTEEGTLALADF